MMRLNQASEGLDAPIALASAGGLVSPNAGVGAQRSGLGGDPMASSGSDRIRSTIAASPKQS